MHVLDLIFPPRCGGCGDYGATWCPTCAAGVRPLSGGTLGGIPLVAAGSLEGSLQRGIHTFKYRSRPQLAAALGVPLARATRAAGVSPRALTFVPLHPDRRRERGFNQAELLARQLARGLGLPLRPGLTRIRPTPAQVGRSEAERRANVVGAFHWSANEAPGPELGLVDDVCTTGTTLQAAAEAIQAAGGSIAAYLVLAVPAGGPQTLAGLAVTSRGQSACP